MGKKTQTEPETFGTTTCGPADVSTATPAGAGTWGLLTALEQPECQEHCCLCIQRSGCSMARAPERSWSCALGFTDELCWQHPAFGGCYCVRAPFGSALSCPRSSVNRGCVCPKTSHVLKGNAAYTGGDNAVFKTQLSYKKCLMNCTGMEMLHKQRKH